MKPARPARPPAHRGPAEVRIIGGRWKRTPLPVPDLPGLRPTPARVRETLFNWLGRSLDGWRCLDAFAGTGALGLEAASRGAAEVTLVERDPRLARQLREVAARLMAEGVRVEQADGLAVMRRLPPASLELVLLDPPFASDLFAPALQAAAPLLVEGGFLYLEAGTDFAPPALPGLAPWRELRAGQVVARLFHRQDAA